MTAPRVTVLMPVYNGEKHLREAMDSILCQTLTDFDLLIIDDGSTDGSRSVIASYDDLRIRVVRNERNLGLVAALNNGLELAFGEYIARMDCDDIALPDRLEKQVAFLDSHPEVGLCGSGYFWFSGKASKIVRLPEDDEAIRLTLAFQNAFGHFTVMMRRQAIAASGLRYDPAFKYAEDYEFWVRCSRHMKMANLSDALVRYRFHPENTSSLFRQEQRLTADRIREMQLDALEVEASPEHYRIHHQLAEHDFRGSFQDLVLARNWLDIFSTGLTHRSNLPHAEICRRLSLNWYLACSTLANHGPRVWRVFMSSSVGRKARPIFVLKLLIRCLLRHPIVHQPEIAP